MHLYFLEAILIGTLLSFGIICLWEYLDKCLRGK